MTEQALIQNLKEIVNQYRLFKETAIHMKWIDIREEHFDWYRKYPIGMFVNVYEFPVNYLEIHFRDAFVRCCISELAFQEEWDKNFFDTSEAQRTLYIKNAEACGLNPYQDICTWKELRLKSVTADILKGKVREYASRNEIPNEEQNKILSYLEYTFVIEIGGCYAGDSNYIAVGKDRIIMISCGIWD